MTLEHICLGIFFSSFWNVECCGLSQATPTSLTVGGSQGCKPPGPILMHWANNLEIMEGLTIMHHGSRFVMSAGLVGTVRHAWRSPYSIGVCIKVRAWVGLKPHKARTAASRRFEQPCTAAIDMIKGVDVEAPVIH